MADDTVELKFKADLTGISAKLDQLMGMFDKTIKSSGDASKEVSKGIEDNVRRTERSSRDMGSFLGRVAKGIKDDFKNLIAIESLQSALKLSNNMKGAIAQTQTLADTVRRLGTNFGITGDRFVQFQKNLLMGLGQMGLKADYATDALESLSDTGVKGEQAVMEYAKSGGALAQITGEDPRAIMRGIQEILLEQGKNVSDKGNVQSMSSDLLKGFRGGRIKPTEAIETIKSLFAAMPKDMRSKMTGQGMVDMASMTRVGGKGALEVFEKFLKMPETFRQKGGIMSGFEKVITAKGVDVAAFSKFYKSILERAKTDPTIATSTLGLTAEGIQGFQKLGEHLSEMKEAVDGNHASLGNLQEDLENSRGLWDAFSASISRVSGMIGTVLAPLEQGAARILGKAAQGDGTAVATVAGAGILAAVLASIGLKGIGKGLGLGGNIAAGAAAKMAGATPVWVVNASDIGGGANGALTQVGQAMGFLSKALGVVGVGVAAYQVGKQFIQPALHEATKQTDKSGRETDLADRLVGGYLDWVRGTNVMGRNEEDYASITSSGGKIVYVKEDGTNLKTVRQPTRGGSQ